MARVFYNSVSDSWRLGVAENFPNTTTVFVTDVETQAKEVVRPEDVFVPSETSLLQMNKEEDATARQYVTCDDATRMAPAPLDLAPLLQCLRQRHRKDVDTLYIGDNVAVMCLLATKQKDVLATPPRQRIGEAALATESTAEHHHPPAPQQLAYSIARKVVVALQATKLPQVVITNGSRTLSTCRDAAVEVATLLNCSPQDSERIAASHVVLQAFTHTIDDVQCCLREAEIHIRDGEADGLTVAQYNYTSFECTMFDVDAIVRNGASNFLAVAFLIYGFTNEEKERCFIPRKQTNFHAQQTIEDPSHVMAIRRRYFVFSRAMETLGFEVNTQLVVFARIAAVLHLLEVTYDEEGNPTNLSALKNAARLLQTDFNSLTHVLTGKEQCEAVAKLLYYSVVNYLIRKMNAALNPKGLNTPCGVTVLGVPPVRRNEGAVPMPVSSLFFNALHEDLHQCFLRTSEQEILQCQEQGYVVPDEVEALFDADDNYSLLKLLKGKGGVLQLLLPSASSIRTDVAATTAAPASSQSTASAADPTKTPGASSEPEPAHPPNMQSKDVSAEARLLLNRGLQGLAKFSKLEVDVASGLLRVTHSFGGVNYAIPSTRRDFEELDSPLFHTRYNALREHLLATCDIETQEALYIIEQSSDRFDTTTMQLSHDLQSLAKLLTSKSAFWWARVVDTTQGFSGKTVASFLANEALIPATIRLRQVLSRRFIPASYEYVSKRFAKLAPRNKVLPTAETPLLRCRNICSEICSGCKIPFVLGSTVMLLSSSELLDMQQLQVNMRERSVLLIQSACRSGLSIRSTSHRARVWKDALADFDRQQDDAVVQHRNELMQAERKKAARLELEAKEHQQRSAMAEQYWIDWVALRTQHQQKLEEIIVKSVAATVRAERHLANASVTQHKALAMNNLLDRIQSQLGQQGAKLDNFVKRKVTEEEQRRQHERRVEQAMERVTRVALAREEARLDLENQLLKKQDRQKFVAVKREKQREDVRNALWEQQERDRIVRKQLEKTREAIALQQQEEMYMKDVEHKLTQRLAEEVTERQRRDREMRRKMLREAREQREGKFQTLAKKHAQALAFKEKRRKEQEEEEARKKRMAAQKIWEAQERERDAEERAKREAEYQEKVLTRSLLRAHDLLNSPVYFEQSPQGPTLVPTKRTHVSAVSNEGFKMAGGRVTRSHLLNNKQWEGVVQFHSTERSRTPQAVLDASPRSILSLQKEGVKGEINSD